MLLLELNRRHFSLDRIPIKKKNSKTKPKYYYIITINESIYQDWPPLSELQIFLKNLSNFFEIFRNSVREDILKILSVNSITIILAALTNLPMSDSLTLYFRKKNLITIQVSDLSD